jgi:hypothetical protein
VLLVTFPGPRHLNCWAARLREPEPRWWLREGGERRHRDPGGGVPRRWRVRMNADDPHGSLIPMRLFARLRRAVWTSVLARGALIADVLLDARPNRAAPGSRPVEGKHDTGGA